MKVNYVTSSNVNSISYDPRSKNMVVEFHSERIYRYSRVPSNEVRNLLKAPSVGRYLNTHIIGSYDVEEIFESEELR